VDLIAIVAATLLLLPLVYAVPFEPLRIVLGLLLVLCFPGYVLLATMFPRQGNLKGVERVALSLGLSIALVPLLGLILNFTPWGIRLTPIVLSLSLWTVLFAGVAWHRRKQITSGERYEVRLEPLVRWFRGPHRVVNVLMTVLLAFSLVAVLAVIGWRVQQGGSEETFTEYYILGAGGLLTDYPTVLRLDEPQEYTLGIVNHERKVMTYVIRAFLDGVEVTSVGPMTLDAEEKWEGQINVVPASAGEEQKLEMHLYRDMKDEVYLSVHLFVDVLEP